mmetsp:Transcript_116089/g.375075  ORF Transcript_116089/g.375075 Transcript_116089/m.375075 type:complete len:258 (-) Transcript_116089:780-1553(-)
MPRLLKRTTSPGVQPAGRSSSTSEPSRCAQDALKPKVACSRETVMTVWRSASATVCWSPSAPRCTLNSTWPGNLPGVWCPISWLFCRTLPSLAPGDTLRRTGTDTSRQRSRLSCSRSLMATTWRPKGVFAYLGTWTFSGGQRPQSLQCSASGSARQPRQSTRRLNSKFLTAAPCTSSLAEMGTWTSMISLRIWSSICGLTTFFSSCAFFCSICCAKAARCGWFLGTSLSFASSCALLPSISLKPISMLFTSCTPPRS